MISKEHRDLLDRLKYDLDSLVYYARLESTEYGGTELTPELAIAALRELADELQHSLDNPPPETGGDPWDRIGDVDEAQEWRDFDPEA